jgi:SAM-dependent methyltransferase
MDLQTLWNRQLDYQVRLSGEKEAEYLRQLPAFQKARRVLEVGAGNGAFLTYLASGSLTREFHGIDLSSEMVQTARRRAQKLDNVTFAKGDIFAADPDEMGKFDLVVARLVVQHLSDLDRFLKMVSQMLNANGTLVIAEADDDGITLEPHVEKVESILAIARRKQPKGGPKRALRLLRKIAPDHGFEIESQDTVKSVASGPEKATVVKMWENLSLLLTKVYNVTSDRKEVHKALKRWQSLPDAKGSFTFQYLTLKKK